jgi:hypothetical protein
MTLEPGSRIGQYEVRDLLGVGGMGEVYRAHDLRLGREVALKTLPAAFVADGERAARFEREARILATLNHPNIATVHGLEKESGLLALVMELVEGETLEDRLRHAAARNGGLALPAALHIARQLVGALDAAHQKGFVHRDLKPANIKVGREDEVKVLDFGLAKHYDLEREESLTQSTALTRHGAVLGTPAYMSPEQARGQPVDKRTDIWAFGCILFEMLAGRPAFEGGTMSDTLAAVLTTDVDLDALPANVPASVRRLLALCLEKSPNARLRDIADARPHLDMQFVAGAGQPSAATPLSRRMVLTGAALASLGVGFAGGALVGRRRTQTREAASFRRLTFRRGMVRTARFGPDFQTVLYGALWDGDVCRVYTVRSESPESTPLPLPPATPLAVSASGELAVAIGTHFRGIMTYGTLARVPLAGSAPRELEENIKYADWSPDGDLAIVRGVGGRDRLEFPVGAVIAEPDTPGGGFSFPRVAPDGNSVAAFELGTAGNLFGRVVIVDRSGTKRLESRNYFNVFGLAWRGDEVWFTAAGELPLLRNTLYALDASGAVRVVARVPSNTTLHDLAPDGRALIAQTDDRGGIAVRAPDEMAERDLSWLDAPSLADMSPDGRQILFSETGVGGGSRMSTYLRGTDGSFAVRLGDGFARALSPDGRWAVVSPDFSAPHFDLIPTGPGQVVRLERPGLRLLDARWLADARRLVVAAQAENGPRRLYVLDVEGEDARPITPEDVPVTVAWAVAPDATMVAVSTSQGIVLFPIGGGEARTVPDTSSRSSVVGWIEGGLLVSEDPAAGGLVLRVDPTNGARATWADIQPRDAAGIMSLDLNSFVVTRDGRGYGYTWHRAMSNLYLVEGWS